MLSPEGCNRQETALVGAVPSKPENEHGKWKKTNLESSPSDDSLIRGGPFYTFQRVTGVVRPDRWDSQRQLIFAVAVGWVPLLLITLLFQRESVMSFLEDYRIHARMLIAVPVLLLGQRVVETRFLKAVKHLRDAHLLADADLAREHEIMVGLRQLRDSVLPELIILLLVIVHTSLSFSKLIDATPWLATATGTSLRLTPAGWYAVLVSASIFQLLMGLSLWKWLLWSIFAFRLSRVSLNLVPIHSDQHGGLGFLSMMANGFAPVSFAATAVIAAQWRHEILHNHAHLMNFKYPAIALVVIVLALAILPLVFFVPPLSTLRRKGILEYSTLGQIQTTEFDQKWIAHRAGHEPEVLTEMESSNVIDFSAVYDRVKQLRPLLVDKRTLIPLALSIVIPALPMILAEVPIAVAVKDLMKALR